MSGQTRTRSRSVAEAGRGSTDVVFADGTDDTNFTSPSKSDSKFNRIPSSAEPATRPNKQSLHARSKSLAAIEFIESDADLLLREAELDRRETQIQAKIDAMRARQGKGQKRASASNSISKAEPVLHSRAASHPNKHLSEAEAIVVCQSVARRWLAKRAIAPEMKRYRRRLAIAKELLSTEKEYVANLALVASLHMVHIRQQNWFSQKEFRVVFSELETILGFNQMFLEALSVAMKDFNVHTTLLSPILGQLKTLLRVYPPYVNNYVRAHTLLEDRTQTNDELMHWLYKTREDPKCRHKDLDDFLINPVQRMPRYVMLVRDLVEYTWESHPDFDGLQTTLTMIEDEVVGVNEKKREDEATGRVAAAFESLRDFDTSRWTELQVLSRRALVREGDLIEWTSATPGKQERFHFFLFSDVLVWSRPQKKKSQYDFHRLCFLRHLDFFKPVSADTVSLSCKIAAGVNIGLSETAAKPYRGWFHVADAEGDAATDELAQTLTDLRATALETMHFDEVERHRRAVNEEVVDKVQEIRPIATGEEAGITAAPKSSAGLKKTRSFLRRITPAGMKTKSVEKDTMEYPASAATSATGSPSSIQGGTAAKRALNPRQASLMASDDSNGRSPLVRHDSMLALAELLTKQHAERKRQMPPDLPPETKGHRTLSRLKGKFRHKSAVNIFDSPSIASDSDIVSSKSRAVPTEREFSSQPVLRHQPRRQNAKSWEGTAADVSANDRTERGRRGMLNDDLFSSTKTPSSECRPPLPAGRPPVPARGRPKFTPPKVPPRPSPKRS